MKKRMLLRENWNRITSFYFFGSMGLAAAVYGCSIYNAIYNWTEWEGSGPVRMMRLSLIFCLTLTLSLCFNELFSEREKQKRVELWEKYKMVPISKQQFYAPKFLIIGLVLLGYTTMALLLYLGISFVKGYPAGVGEVLEGITFIWTFGICFTLCEWVFLKIK